MLLLLAAAHWAYHKNREWNELVAELLHGIPYPESEDLGMAVEAEPAAGPPCQIDLTFPTQARPGAR